MNIQELKEKSSEKLIEEAEKLCDRICFVVKGKIVLSETKKKIMNKFKKRKLEDFFIKFTKS